MNFDWQANGFDAPPIPKVATGTEELYRAWGGDRRRKWGNTDLPGVCFSLDEASSRWHAETTYSVMEYQNAVRFLTKFSIPSGTPFWYGKVDAGDPRAILGNISGNQVLIERAYMVLVKEISTVTLSNDLGRHEVYSGKSPRLPS